MKLNEFTKTVLVFAICIIIPGVLMSPDTGEIQSMELLNEDEINFIAKQCGFSKVINWYMEEIQHKVNGYLGHHLNLIMEVESNGTKTTLNLFVKCLPTFNKWKTQYLKDGGFFKREYIILSRIFNEFKNVEGSRKWHPKVLFVKEDIFVFENVSLLGYKVPHYQDTMTYEEIKASVTTLARFHAQSYIYEEKKSKELNRSYSIWEHYSEILQLDTTQLAWRDTGRNAVIDYLKVFSKHKSKPNFNRYIESIVPKLFNCAFELMKPSSEYRNVVMHGDLWSNNIFLKKEENSTYHALLIDYQTVTYSSPMLDLSSLMYFNTKRRERDNWIEEFINVYYTVLSEELQAEGVKIENIIDKTALKQEYDKSRVFGITQAALIVPVSAMSKKKRDEILCNDELSKRSLVGTRSKDFIDVANKDDKYRITIIELLDEIVERYVFPKDTGVNLDFC